MTDGPGGLTWGPEPWTGWGDPQRGCAGAVQAGGALGALAVSSSFVISNLTLEKSCRIIRFVNLP